MKQKKLFIILFVFTIILPFISCDSNYKHLGDGYYLRRGDLHFMVDIGYGYSDSEDSAGFIDQTVFEVYWNDDYIIAKRHPSLEETKTEYFVVKKIRDNIKLAVKNRYGPLNYEQYINKIIEFNLDTNSMEHIVFDDLK